MNIHLKKNVSCLLYSSIQGLSRALGILILLRHLQIIDLIVSSRYCEKSLFYSQKLIVYIQKIKQRQSSEKKQ